MRRDPEVDAKLRALREERIQAVAESRLNRVGITHNPYAVQRERERVRRIFDKYES
jgi:hypothetical protein